MKTILLIFVVTLAFVACVKADRYHHHHSLDLTVTPTTTQTTNVTETIYYEADKCIGVPLAMAVGNNQLYMGTDKPQASIGVGECGGSLAGSAMFGMKLRNNLMVNGSWGFDDNDVNAFGLGATFVFK